MAVDHNNSVGSKLEDLFFLFRFVRFAERRRSDLGLITPAIRTTPPAQSAKLNVYVSKQSQSCYKSYAAALKTETDNATRYRV